MLFTVRPEGLTATAGWLTARAAAWERQAAITGKRLRAEFSG